MFVEVKNLMERRFEKKVGQKYGVDVVENKYRREKH